ncbi:MAG: UDP-N-acetylmuramoyl-L-alanine--D-glutamate ligase [Methylococcales bacterium]|nr:UDP-N-acetylmuramoyl-L-alanine--D-glutamate ligase [Methylococcales bacterium]
MTALTLLREHFQLDPETSRVVIVGAGLTGFSVARWLKVQGIRFAVVDSRDRPPALAQLQQDIPDAPVFTGGFDQAAFQVATHMLVSPGVSLAEPSIAQALAKGVRCFSDIDIFQALAKAPIVAVTGSNGKSTVTTLVAEIARAAGIKAAAGGNLGTPALDLLADDVALYVLELSSFQLERCHSLQPDAAVVLNISPDHLDRYPDLARYRAAKQAIFAQAKLKVINRDDPHVANMVSPGTDVIDFSITHPAACCVCTEQDQAVLYVQGQRLLAETELAMVGRHNTANMLAACALAAAVHLPITAMRQVGQRFTGLAHRMQTVAVKKGITWINDSKATNIGACVAALSGFTDKVLLIAGGDAKGAELQELAPALSAHVEHLFLMGRDAPQLAQLAKQLDLHYELVDSVEQAVRKAAYLAQPGQTVLLSPACASLDQYRDYADRGQRFSTAVRELKS